MRKVIGGILLALLCISFCGCNMSTMDDKTVEKGILFSKLPWGMGGIKDEIVAPGQTKIYPFWIDCYAIPTAMQSVTWSGVGSGNNPEVNDQVNTRAGDGNEVFLDVTVQYSIIPDKIKDVLFQVGPKPQDVSNTVQSWARSYIRTSLGKLMTNEFYDNTKRYEATSHAQAELNRALNPFGIKVENVIFDEHHFDEAYQQLIDQSKQVEQQSQEQKNLVDTTKAE